MNQNIKTWQQELAEGFTNINDLCDYLHVFPDNISSLADFPLKVPKHFVDNIEKGNLNDPLLKQILPIKDETMYFSGFNTDPVGDIDAITETGIIHKYQNRVLFITTGSCAIHCRYCFRKNFPYNDFQLSKQKWTQALDYVKHHKNISEVILSGGDPLLLNDQNLFNLLNQLDSIDNIKRIRIHSRIPIVLPSRITPQFCHRIAIINKPVILVIHSNHTNELSNDVNIACKKLKNANVILLNQSVLLKGVNDDVQQLSALSEKLFTFGIMPYYLHLLDKATGTGHFEVEEKKAVRLMNQVKSQLSGYLIPKLVREQTGAAHKIVIG